MTTTPPQTLFVRKYNVVLDESTRILGNFELPPEPADDEAIYYDFKKTNPELPRTAEQSWEPFTYQQLDFEQLNDRIGDDNPSVRFGEFRSCAQLRKFVQPEPTQGSTFPISFPDGKRCYWGNGASVHGTRQEASTVFMRLPYLGFEGNYPTANTNVEEFTESLTLPEYSRVMADEILPTDFRINRNAEYNKIWVHQVWVIVVNNESILVSRSANDGNEQARPLLAPGQPFESIYHSLFQMLSRFLKLPDRKLLELFRRIVLRYERSSLLTEDQSFTDSETIRRDLAHMLMVKSMLDDQIGVLESLGEIFEHATGYSYEADINRTDVDRVYIPHLTDESTIARDVQRLRNLITERKQHREKFASLIAAIRKMFDTVQAGDTKTATQTALNQQLKYAEALNDEVAYQGKTISMFTAINVLFLPLGFFAQYLGLGFNQINTLVNFWRITGPLTAIIIIPTVYIVLISKYKTRQFAKFFWLCCKGRVRGFLNAPDSQTQEKYLKGLPKYRIALEELVPPYSDVATPPGSGGSQQNQAGEKAAQQQPGDSGSPRNSAPGGPPAQSPSIRPTTPAADQLSGKDNSKPASASREGFFKKMNFRSGSGAGEGPSGETEPLEQPPTLGFAPTNTNNPTSVQDKRMSGVTLTGSPISWIRRPSPVEPFITIRETVGSEAPHSSSSSRLDASTPSTNVQTGSGQNYGYGGSSSGGRHGRNTSTADDEHRRIISGGLGGNTGHGSGGSIGHSAHQSAGASPAWENSPASQDQATTEDDTASKPPRWYLQCPDEPFEKTPVTFSRGEPSAVFRFDEKLGYLFLDVIDRNDNLYYAHVKASSPALSNPFCGLEWKRIRRPYDKDPPFFKGRWEKRGEELWVMCRTGGPKFWDNALPDGRKNRWGGRSSKARDGLTSSRVFAAMKPQQDMDLERNGPMNGEPETTYWRWAKRVFAAVTPQRNTNLGPVTRALETTHSRWAKRVLGEIPDPEYGVKLEATVQERDHFRLVLERVRD